MEAATAVTYGDLIVEALTRYSSREAFVCGDRRLTYEDAGNITRRLMGALDARGVGPGMGVERY